MEMQPHKIHIRTLSKKIDQGVELVRRNPELVLTGTGGDIGVGVRIDVWIDPDADPCAESQARGHRIDYEYFL